MNSNNLELAAQQVTEKPIWEKDALERKSYADFLTQYLTGRTQSSTPGLYKPFCIALDAEWGAGKTYFIRNWSAQLQKDTKHPTFVFDAWEFDSNAEPTIAFMSAFRNALSKEIAKLPVTDGVKVRAELAVKNGVKALGNAMMPVSKAVLKGVLNKLLPGVVKDLQEAIGDGKLDIDEFDLEKIGSEGVEGAKSALGKFFEESLKQPSDRKKLLDAFKMHIQDVLKLLHEEGGCKLPFFVFVDELDRCRPTFAVSLLEELKHIFNIPGMCFVVSTNISQLAHSVGAVYGEKFDGRNYLQRFFDSECALPAPSIHGYLNQLFEEFPAVAASNVLPGLPRYSGFSVPEREVNAASTIEWVSDVFQLDLRTVKKMVGMIDASVSTISPNKKVHLVWLTILAASRIKSPELFVLLSTPGSAEVTIEQSWAMVATGDSPRFFKTPRISANAMAAGDHSVVLKQVALLYHAFLGANLLDVRDAVNSSRVNVHEYPQSLKSLIADEAPNSYLPGAFYPTSFASYGQLMKQAGHVQV